MLKAMPNEVDGEWEGRRFVMFRSPLAGELALFSEECGPDAMRLGYRWDAPRSLVTDEAGLSFHQLTGPHGRSVGDFIGWAIVWSDPRCPEDTELTIGVRPRYVGRGYRRLILEGASQLAIRAGARWVTAGVWSDNDKQLDRYFDDAKRGSAFQPAGVVLKPGASWYLFTRVVVSGG